MISNEIRSLPSSSAIQKKSSIGTDKQNGSFSSFVINDKLTPSDKSLVIAATGGLNQTSPSGTMQINDLAVRIALDRETGVLTGEVDKSYINNLINEQRSMPSSSKGKNHTIPFSFLEKALSYLEQKNQSYGANINTTA